MEPIPVVAARSTRRCRNRQRALLLLSSMGEAFPAQLADALGVSTWALHGLMHGRLPYYSVDLALVPAGLAVVRWGPGGRHYAITTRGRRKARSLAAGRARRRAPLA